MTISTSWSLQMFVVVLIQIRHMKANSPAGSRQGLIHNLKGVASLTLLLGLTWTVGFFTWGPARIFMLYLFAGLNSLQGQTISEKREMNCLSQVQSC